MDRLKALKSCLLAGLAAASPDVLIAADDVDTQRDEDTRLMHRSPAPDRSTRNGVMDSRAAAFIDAFNSADLGAIVAFEIHHRASLGDDSQMLQARLAEHARQRAQFGSLDVHAVLPLGDRAVTMTARGTRKGEWVSIVLTFDDEPPYRIRASRIDPMLIPV